MSLLGSTTNTPPNPDPGNLLSPANAECATQDWKSEITSRVRARRTRTGRLPASQPALPGMEDALAPGSIAARVAERYSRLPSYRDVMEAQAAAGTSPLDSPDPAVAPELGFDPPPDEVAVRAERPAARQQNLLHYSVSSDSLPAARPTPPEARAEFSAIQAGDHPDDVRALLAHAMDAALVEPTVPLPASLLAQPRELISFRKARPRLAEGPLREGPETAAADATAPDRAIAGQPDGVANSFAGGGEARASQAAPEADPAMPRHSPPVSSQWLSIELDTGSSVRQDKTAAAAKDSPALQVAPLEDRFFAGLIDIALTLVAFLMFFLVFIFSSTSLPHGRLAFITAGVTLFAMWLIYQLLFFGFTDATPGMRYLRIALCTFDDENPTRRVLRGRIAASLLSALPLGLGYLWAIFDEDSLGWHDRITQTYQRSYREN